MTQQGPFKTLKEMSKFEKTFSQELINNGVAWKQLHEGATILSSGIGHASFINDDALSGALMMYSKRKVETSVILSHTYGVFKHLQYQKKNRDAMTGEQEFTRRFGERYASEILSSAQAQPLTPIQCETIRESMRGKSDIREKVLAQCGIIIEMIKAKITPSYWNKLISHSLTFRRGISNRCVLSVMEGMREAVSNPGGEDEVKADANREAAEKQFLAVKFSKDQQLDPFMMEEYIDPFIQTIWRTTSTWTDIVIIRKLLSKLDNVVIYKDIARNWDSSQKYAGCDSIELFWRIIQLECEIYIDTSGISANEEDSSGIGGTSYMAIPNPISNSGTRKTECFEYTRKAECFEYQKSGTCKYGDSCKHLHLTDVRSVVEDSKHKRKDFPKDASKEVVKQFDEKQLRTAFSKFEEERKRQRNSAGSTATKPLGALPVYPKAGGAKIYHAEMDEASEADDELEREKDFQAFYTSLRENNN
jgi:hypothetical protein